MKHAAQPKARHAVAGPPAHRLVGADRASPLVRGAIAAALAVGATGGALAAEAAGDEPRYSGNVAGYYYAMRDQPDFGVGIASINRGSLHFETRYNYEARNSTSLLAGWKFAGGDAVTWEVTPLVGGLTGATRGRIVGLEASVAYKAFDFYTEVERVDGLSDGSSAYVYAWSELGWRPAERVRVGLVGQRTLIVSGDRDVQPGVFAQLTVAKATLSLYAFNPDSGSRYTILAVGFAF
jgi:hypothetical protein